MFESEEFFFPVESVFLAIEVKSQVTATEIKSAHQKAKDILERIGYSPGLFLDCSLFPLT